MSEKKPTLTVKQLRTELASIGEDTRGAKAELQARLDAANARAMEQSENPEMGGVCLSDDEDAPQGGQIVAYEGPQDEYYDDELDETDLPSRKRRRENCPCYSCTGETFTVTHAGMIAVTTSICATLRLGCSLARSDLKLFTNMVPLGLSINGVVYNPRRCPAVQIATSHPECSVNLYSCEDGPAKMVCLGARTKEQARTAMRRVARLVKFYLDVPAVFRKFTVTNYIMSGDIKFEVNLHHLLYLLNADGNNPNDANTASYEPELSPKLSYHMTQPAVIKLDVFHTGKMNILRCLSREDLTAAFGFLHPILLQCKVQEQEVLPVAAPKLAVLPEGGAAEAGAVQDVVSPGHEQMLDGFSDMLEEFGADL